MKNKNLSWKKLLITIGTGLAILSIIINLVSYKYLPEKVGLQLNTKGILVNYVPRLIFIVITPIVVFISNTYSFIAKDDNTVLKGFIVEIIFFVVNIIIIFSNVKFY